MLRGIFGIKGDQLRGSWKKRQENLHNLYPSRNIIGITTVRRMKKMGRTARM